MLTIIIISVFFAIVGILVGILMEHRASQRLEEQIKRVKRKRIWIEQYIDERGFTVMSGDCGVCNQFPCDHIEMGFDGWRIKPFPKIPKDKKRAKIREGLTIK